MRFIWSRNRCGSAEYSQLAQQPLTARSEHLLDGTLYLQPAVLDDDDIRRGLVSLGYVMRNIERRHSALCQPDRQFAENGFL